MNTKQIITALVLPLPAFGQSVWTGGVADDRSIPVPFANIVALSLPDSVAVCGGTCDADGRFALRVPPSACLLRISAVGYAACCVRPDSLRDSVDFRTVRLDADGRLLGEANVTAARPVSRIVGDALVTGVENTLLAKAGTAEDVLARVPGIVRKKDGLEVLGRGTPVIYINGRRLRDPEELSRLASTDIRSVEVIRNPGPRYEADVSAVVRIRTVRRTGDGFSADAKVAYEQGRHASGTGTLDLNYRHRSLDVFGSSGYAREQYYWDGTMEQDVFVDDRWRQRSVQHILNRVRKPWGTLGLDYAFSERHSAGLRYSLEGFVQDEGGGWFNGEVLRNGVFYDRLDNDIVFEERHDPKHKLNAYYAGRIGAGELDVDADWYADGRTKYQTTAEHSQEHDDRLVRSSNPRRNRLVAVKAGYAFPLAGGRLTAGGQYVRTDRRDDYLVPVEAYGIVTSRSRIEEWQAAVFAEYARAVGRWQLTAGLRYEHVRFDYSEQGVRRPEQCRTYDNLYPGLSAATAFGPVQFIAAYSVKTSRPTYSQLSNNMVYANRFLMQSGNPTLRPTVGHDFSVTAVWKWLQAVVDFRHERDCVINWGGALPDNPSATKIYPVNRDVPRLTAMLAARPKIGPWQPTWNVAFIRNWLELEVAGGRKNFDNPLVAVTWNNAFELPAGFTADAGLTYQSRGNYQNVALTGGRNCYIDVSLRKSFLRDALSITVGGKDLLHRMGGEGARVYMYQSTLLQDGRGDTRRFHVTVRYRFNPVRSKYKGGAAAADEMRRL